MRHKQGYKTGATINCYFYVYILELIENNRSAVMHTLHTSEAKLISLCVFVQPRASILGGGDQYKGEHGKLKLLNTQSVDNL